MDDWTEYEAMVFALGGDLVGLCEIDNPLNQSTDLDRGRENQRKSQTHTRKEVGERSSPHNEFQRD